MSKTHPILNMYKSMMDTKIDNIFKIQAYNRKIITIYRIYRVYA